MKETKPKAKIVKKPVKEKTEPVRVAHKAVIHKPLISKTEKPIEKVLEKKPMAKIVADEKFTSALGRRKRASVRVRMYAPGSGKIEINGKDYITYFGVFKEKVVEPLRVVGKLTDFDFTLKAEGGGMVGQAEGSALGIARALIKFNEDYRTVLKSNKLLTRDSREKERKKFGLKRARHAPQWSKR